MTEKLGLTVAPMQLPMGIGDDHVGVIDLIKMKALYFEGATCEDVVEKEIPAEYIEHAAVARFRMLETVCMHNDELMEMVLEEKPIDEELLRATIRQATVNREIVPVFFGSAYHNKGVQPMLDGVSLYLPSPIDRSNFARDHDNEGAEVPLVCDPAAPLVAMVFKIVDESFGQLSYTRVYQGTLEKGMTIHNARTNQEHRVGRIVRMHADKRADIEKAVAGDIVAMVAVDCASGDTFCAPNLNLSMESIFVADPVIKLSIIPATSADQDKMAKALNRFMKEDPTFRVSTDPETSETVIAGMGELHLDVYAERIRREYKAVVTVGTPKVSYREAPAHEAPFDYKHKKQSGGSGQYGHVVGRLIPLPDDSEENFEFVDEVRGGRIPREYIPAVCKGFEEAMKKGPLAGYEIRGCKMVLEDGSYHDVDSSEMAFRIAGIEAFKQAFMRSKPMLLEPVMSVEVETPNQFQGPVVGDLNSRRGMIMSVENKGVSAVIRAEVPLATMFGYATIVRSLSQGMATFSMELCRYGRVPTKIADEIIATRKKEQAARK
jgi:elongation factor G